jgi:hypothetical protein
MAGLIQSIENGVVSGNHTLPTALRSHDALSYARRPSSTNTHSTIPLLHRHSFVQHNSAVQDTVQTPWEKTLAYRAQLPLLTITITAVVHMVLLYPRWLRR